MVDLKELVAIVVVITIMLISSIILHDPLESIWSWSILTLAVFSLLGAALAMATDQKGHTTAVFAWAMMLDLQERVLNVDEKAGLIVSAGFFLFLLAQVYSMCIHKICGNVQQVAPPPHQQQIAPGGGMNTENSPGLSDVTHLYEFGWNKGGVKKTVSIVVVITIMLISSFIWSILAVLGLLGATLSMATDQKGYTTAVFAWVMMSGLYQRVHNVDGKVGLITFAGFFLFLLAQFYSMHMNKIWGNVRQVAPPPQERQIVAAGGTSTENNTGLSEASFWSSNSSPSLSDVMMTSTTDTPTRPEIV